MRPQIVKKILLNLFVHLLVIGTAMGNEKRPPPPTRDNHIPPPPYLDLDSNIIVLMAVGILFGLYLLYRNKPLKL